MSTKLAIEDWTNPPKAMTHAWYGSATVPDLVSCSPRWCDPAYARKPRADAGATVVGMSMSMLYYLGVPSGAPGDMVYEIATDAVAKGYDQFPMRLASGALESNRFRNFSGGGTDTYMLNVARPEVSRWLAAKMDPYLQPFDGWHVDYWTSMQFIFSGAPLLNVPYVGVGPADDSFWTAWGMGLNRTVHALRALRAARGQSTLVIGQQYHNTTDWELTGRFNEVAPWTYPSSPAPYATWQQYHQAQFDAFPATTLHGGSKSKMVVNLRYPLSATAQQRADVIAFCQLNDCYCAWGIEDTAGQYWPG